MNPSLRSQLRDSLRARSDTEGWRALIAQHGTPLLVLDPYRVVEQCRADEVPSARVRPALRGEDAAPSGGAAGGRRQRLRLRRGDEGRGRSPWRAGPSHRPVHQHQPDQEAHRHRPRLHRQAFAPSSSTIRSRPRSSRVCPPTSTSLCGSRSRTRRRSRICPSSSVQTPPTPNSSSSTYWPPGSVSPASAFTSAARERSPSRTVSLCVARWISSRILTKHSASQPNHRHRRRISGQLPRADADDRRDRRRRRRGAR